MILIYSKFLPHHRKCPRFLYDYNIKHMQSFQIFKIHRLSLINGFVFSTRFRTAAEGSHVKSPAQRFVNCKPLVQLFVAK